MVDLPLAQPDRPLMSAPLDLPDYNTLEHLLRAAETVGAAEAHGLIAGVLCAPRADVGALAKTVLADMQPGSHAADIERSLGALRAYTQTQLMERTSEFAPFFPEEDAALSERTAALADFCRGYLMGLAAGGVTDLASLSPEAQEIVRDFMEISEADVEPGDAEAEEQAFTELTEYVRVGVQLIYEELHADAQ